MLLRILVLLNLFMLFSPETAFSFQGYIQSVADNATIAWGSGQLSVLHSLSDIKDIPEPLAIRKATSESRRMLLDMILSIRIDSKKTIASYLSEDEEMAIRVRGLVQNSPLNRPALSEGEGVVKVTEVLRGTLAELILPKTIPFQSGIPPRLSSSLEKSLSYSSTGLEEAGKGGVSYSGVIIDARGLQVTPALSPVVFGQDGVAAYGAFQVSRSNAIQRGVVAYATTTDPVELSERVGNNPLTIRALSSFGSWRTDIVISSPMSILVRSIMRSSEVVGRCPVVIVLDAPEMSSTPQDAVEALPMENVQ